MSVTATETDAPAIGVRRPSRFWIWARRIVLGIVFALLLMTAAGVIYQSAGARRDARVFPPPGQLVDLGGYQIHIYCTGPLDSGNPTVILETLSGGVSALWGWVQPEVAEVTRVCSYDRAGRGWSGPRSNPISLQQVADDLHSLLQKAGVPGPYVLVGHSIGGVIARQFIADHPQEVAGLVLVDASHPEQFERNPQLEADGKTFLRLSALFPPLARLGIFRLFFARGGEIDFAGLPEREHDEVAAFWSTPEYFISQRDETIATPQIFTDGQALGSLGDLPLAVVTAGESQPFWLGLQDELASLSKRSIHITVPNATHASLALNQEHARVTSAAILKTVEAARK